MATFHHQPLTKFCNGDYNLPVMFSIYLPEQHSCIGKVVTSMAQIANGKVLNLTNELDPANPAGCLNFRSYMVTEKPTFMSIIN